MYVDCAGDFIVDAGNGNPAHLDSLLNYAQAACFTHLSLFKLDIGNVFGNAWYESILSDFIVDCHNANITVGVVGSKAYFYTENFVSNPTWTPDYDFSANPDFFTGDQIAYLEPLANPQYDRDLTEQYFDIFVRAEEIKFFLRVGVDYNAYHAGKVDAISLENEYWGWTNTAIEALDNYNIFKDILTTMHLIKTCSQSVLNWPLIIEVELGDNKDSKLAVTHEDQAIFIDSLADRILLISYSYYPTNLFKRSCEWLYLLGKTSKPNTVIWPTFSAEAHTGYDSVFTNVWDTSAINQWFQNNCNAHPGTRWTNLLGDWLIYNNPNGLTLAEDQYFSDYNNAIGIQPCSSSTCCPNCISWSTTWNNGDNATIDTIMWFAYTLLDDPNNEYHNSIPWYKIRSKNTGEINLNHFEVSPNPSNIDNLKIKYYLHDFEFTAKIELINSFGEFIHSNNLALNSDEYIINKNLTPGLYFLKMTIDGIQTDFKKIVIIP
jgi:hypothetical protein